MARQSQYYKGQRKKRNYAIVPAAILMLLITLAVVLFYSTQKYAVITDSGVKVVLPLFGGEVITSDESGNAGTLNLPFENTSVAITFDAPDYSRIEATAGDSVKAARAIFVPYGDINPESMEAYANRLKSGNALMLELKTENGYMQWYSQSPIALKYGLNMNSEESTATLQSIVDSMKSKERDVYLIAQISVCKDQILATHASNVILTDQYGMGIVDDTGTYFLDPYNDMVREYTAQLVRELWDMGFDEVVLNNVMHPIIESDGENTLTVSYTKQMSTTPSAVGAVCGFATSVAQQLKERPDKKYLSIYINGPTALVRADKESGQDGRFFLKIYDRVYYNTDMYAYTFNVDDIRPGVTVGNYHDRFVPVVLNYLPDNTSWILVDYDEDE